ncbi:MAG: bifunctional hydroxymethylpyrimidine kinase/phosphomethylpyrimidine kinase [Peptococcaceae bacterium]|nr:bifunctional hydroxymethylpyrimidine kinase/phosphomethylpyrimidine kinase [Peptococcaceae bacterium]
MKTALTVAGSDSCGGAGIQADIKTMTANGVYAMSAVTALTAQNTTSITGIMEVTSEFLGKQLDSIFTDIYPDAVKIGMVSSSGLIETLSEKLKFYNAKNIVVDPVMISTSGSRLIQNQAIEDLQNCLFPQAILLTPNIPEASALSGINIVTESDMIEATRILSNEYGCAVLCKGGHSINDSNDLLYWNHNYRWFIGERIDNENTHGTGCTLSSAITSGLAKGMDLEMSIKLAKKYVSGSLRAMLDLGKGNGPLNHAWNINKEDE